MTYQTYMMKITIKIMIYRLKLIMKMTRKKKNKTLRIIWNWLVFRNKIKMWKAQKVKLVIQVNQRLKKSLKHQEKCKLTINKIIKILMKQLKLIGMIKTSRMKMILQIMLKLRNGQTKKIKTNLNLMTIITIPMKKKNMTQVNIMIKSKELKW